MYTSLNAKSLLVCILNFEFLLSLQYILHAQRSKIELKEAIKDSETIYDELLIRQTVCKSGI